MEMLAKGVKDIAELDPKTALTPHGLESHPGAVKFWNEASGKIQ